MARATLWSQDPDLSAALPFLHALGGITVSVVASLEDLADDEVAVLRDLAAGFKQEEIADNLHLSIARVERMIGTLKHKFGVASTNALCAQAGRFGFIES